MNLRIFVFIGAALLVSAASTGKTRYLAADGNDAADGRTPATAWRTITKLNEALPAGGTARLRCGDVFYGTVKVKGGLDSARRTVITSFGEGPRPVISCTKNLKNDPAIWKSPAERFNYWYTDIAKPSNYSGLVSKDANPGFLLVDGELEPWKHFCRYDINRQWDFSSEKGRLYVYSTNNPALLAKDIRVAVNAHGAFLESHTLVSNIAVRAVGAHGIYAGWREQPTVDLRISDCTFENIGGSELIGYRLFRVRYGNAIELGSNCADVIVERCDIKGVYDVAFTMQGYPTSTGWNDIHMRDCRVEDATQAFEIWCANAKPGMGFSRCSFTGNRTVNVGGGWGALTRPNRATATPLILYRMETDTVDITVTGNVFEKPPLGLLYVMDGEDKLPPGYRVYDNTVR